MIADLTYEKQPCPENFQKTSELKELNRKINFYKGRFRNARNIIFGCPWLSPELRDEHEKLMNKVDEETKNYQLKLGIKTS